VSTVVLEDLVHGLLYSQVLLPGRGGSQTRAWECRDRARAGARREEAQEAVHGRPHAQERVYLDLGSRVH
jgi:hypothetical protein